MTSRGFIVGVWGALLSCGVIGDPAFAQVSSLSSTKAEAIAPAEQLIVFHQPGASGLDAAFVANDLPGLKNLAEEAGVSFSLQELTPERGAPEAVGITPLIVYQNHRGRSVYQGRYTTLDRVKNFIRTSRFVPQGDEKLVREDLPVWDLGSAKVATPIKVTAIQRASGEESSGGATADGNAVMTMAREAIAAADERFTWADRVELGRSDRLFYTDYYPYLSDDGTLYLSLALYSQFHCHEPVFTLMDGSLHGPWENAHEVFARGAKIFADQIARLLDESKLGDGFDVVPADVPKATWESLGLGLPPGPEGASAEAIASVQLVREWVIDEAAQAQRPAVQFKFPAPLDAYAGEVTSIAGTFSLGEDLAIVGSHGKFVADPASVTMGEPDLDDAIHNAMLEVAAYPESFFVIERVETTFAKPAFGQVAAAVMHGRFTMKGITIPLTVPVSIEAFLGDDGEPRLSIDGRWQVRLLDPFGIEGPPGESPTNDTLIYTCHLVFEPV